MKFFLFLFLAMTTRSTYIIRKKKINRKLRSTEIESDNGPLPNVVLVDSSKMKRAYKNASKLKQHLSNDISWSNVVVIIPTYNDEKTNGLVEAGLKTWMRHLGDGADIVLVTDDDDARTDDQILPPIDEGEGVNRMKSNIHIYRSNALKEGRRTRYKVMDAFNYVYTKFGAGNESQKQIFLKVDTDSYMIAENVLDAMVKIQKETYPLPVEFGRGVCLTVDTCYSHGGMYGFNRSGLKLVLSYVSDHPDIYQKLVKNQLNEDNLMNHEDYFTSYVFKEASGGYPIINMLGVSESLMRLKQPYKKVGRPFYSIHNVKDPNDFYGLQHIFYHDNCTMKTVSYDENGLIQWEKK